MATVLENIENTRKKLLDLTFRNKLLNFRPTKARTLKILDENPLDVYEYLVLKEKPMQFRATKISEIDTAPSSSDPISAANKTGESTAETDISTIWQPITPEQPSQNHPADRYLDTPFDKETLQKRLFVIMQESKSVIEEQGYTVLYLALGFLEWYDTPASEKPARSPLILIPVEMKREGIRESFKIQWTNEEIITNISLKERLGEIGVTLPDFEMPEDKAGIDAYFQLVKNAINKQPRWNIFSDVYLDFFSFTKFVMYKDLDSSAWTGEVTPVNHPLINAIFNPDTTSPIVEGFNEEDVDKRIHADSVYHILDADSSQIAVIEDIKAGKNLVVQGPPGTGKSQTIANAIADLLAQGKTVLFISEKMAALEVVKKRLDVVGIGEFCLQLHSYKANIKEVHRKLDKTLHMIPPSEVEISDQISRLESLKDELNSYLEALYEPIGGRNLTPFFLYGENERVQKHFLLSSREMVRFNLPNAEGVSPQEWQSSVIAMNKISEVLPRVRPVQRNPWYGCNPKTILPSDEREIKIQVQATKTAFFELQNKMVALSEVTGLSLPDNFNELRNAVGATKLFVSPNPVDRNLLLNDAWNQPNQQVTLAIEKIRAFQQMRNDILKRFSDKILDENLEMFLKEFQPLSNKFVLLKLLNSQYRALKRNGLSYYRDQKQHSDVELINDFSHILKCINEREQIRNSGAAGRSLFGSLWQDEQSDTIQLREFSEWIVQFRRKMLEDIFTERTVEMMSQGISPHIIEQAANEVTDAWQKFIRLRFELFQRLNFSTEKRFLQDEEILEFPKYQLLLSLWEQNISYLLDWSHYSNFSEDCKKTYAGYIIDVIEEHDLPPEDILPTFRGNYTDELLKKAFTTRPDLARFLGDTHDQKIRSFIDLDKKIIEGNRLRLMWRLYQTIPNINAEASPNSELGILKQQFDRKKNKMPIRKLMKNIGGLIQKITPCFMMGPLSVARFLDPKTVKFDVIIFDEASQVKPEDALGALLRGDQAVVIGDSRQLPPTSFFDKIVADEFEEPEDTSTMPSDMESILNLCKVSFPAKTLRWHYRSRHESLIALSNSEFYDNKLFVYPSPMKRSENLGLKFVHLPNTIYDRGKSQTNRAEAQAVALAVFDHFRNSPDRSLGVGTFNVKQQDAIREEIESLRHLHPEMEQFFREDLAENFFVKNLETIQGDERDVIFLSVGYGKDSTGKLTLNFGPLNQDGGERRLNVLITRAREKCVAFSNFSYRDLMITEKSAFGVRILKLFLQYAESGDLPCSSISMGDTESPFEDAVYEFLVSNNLEVHKQIGCAGFRIDMAVVNPAHPGQYLIGIECDGAQYHSSKVARDRDRLRQQILEGLGWKVHRVWSTDWYRNCPDTKRKLLEEIERTKTLPDPINLEAKKPPTPIISILPENDPNQTSGIYQSVNKTDEHSIPNYRFGTSPTSFNLDFIDTPEEILGAVITDIVSVEGPVHIEELYQRIKDQAAIPRISPKIKEKIHYACKNESWAGRIRIKDDFLWQRDTPKTLLRRRNPDQGVAIEWICDEEIGEAIDYILNKQYATTEDDLILSARKIFGIAGQKNNAYQKIRRVIQDKLKTNELEILPNGKIFFKK
jgi:very-short-patch-repair endonuclease/DNA polymerase III delta prime subunit